MDQLIQHVDQHQMAAALDSTMVAGTPAHVPFDYASDRRLQRQAMGSMWLAMLVMSLGMPAHLGVRASADPLMHATTGWASLAGWLACVLTSITLWVVRGQFAATWQDLRRARLSGEGLVTLGALAAYIVSLTGLDASAHGTPVYFDVTAMALAWLVAGAAQRADLHRRYVTTLEQLAPLGNGQLLPLTVTIDRSARQAGWIDKMLAVVLLGTALLAVSYQLRTGQPLHDGLIAGLAALAVTCPCTLGIARSSACATGAARAAAAGWIVAAPAAFWSGTTTESFSPAALRLGTASPTIFAQIARAVRRAIWLNTCWALGFNLLLLPLALGGPLDPRLPAAIMVLAWALIALTNRGIRHRSGAELAQS